MVKYHEDCPEVAVAAWKQGYLTPLQLFRIAAWKTGQGLGWLSLNEEVDIRDRTHAALDDIRPWRRKRMVGVTSDVEWIKWREASRSAIGADTDGTGLIGLWGVGYPMATAILSVLLPTTFPVMDRWAVQTVFGRQPNGKPISDSKWQRAAAYESYARHLSSEGSRHWGRDKSIHELDVHAMKASMKGGAPPAGWRLALLPS